jgi:hypothetical protein
VGSGSQQHNKRIKRQTDQQRKENTHNKNKVRKLIKHKKHREPNNNIKSNQQQKQIINNHRKMKTHDTQTATREHRHHIQMKERTNTTKQTD